MNGGKALGYQSSAAPSDIEIERDELRERLDQIEEAAEYVFSVEATMGGKDDPIWGHRWMPYAAYFDSHIDAKTTKDMQQNNYPNRGWRVVRTMRVTLREVME